MFDYQYHDHKLYNKTLCCKIKLTVQCRPLLSWHLTIIIIQIQSSQFSRIECESHAFRCNLTLSRRHEHFLRIDTFLEGTVTLPFKLSEVLMNSECAPLLAVNFG